MNLPRCLILGIRVPQHAAGERSGHHNQVLQPKTRMLASKIAVHAVECCRGRGIRASGNGFRLKATQGRWRRHRMRPNRWPSNRLRHRPAVPRLTSSHPSRPRRVLSRRQRPIRHPHLTRPRHGHPQARLCRGTTHRVNPMPAVRRSPRHGPTCPRQQMHGQAATPRASCHPLRDQQGGAVVHALERPCSC